MTNGWPTAAGRARRAVTLGAALAGLAAGWGAPAAAQQRDTHCDDCEVRLPMETRERIKSEMKALQRELAKLQREEDDDGVKRALRETARALDDLDAETLKSQLTLARAIGRLASEQDRSSEAREDPERFAELTARLGALQGQLAAATALRATAAAAAQRTPAPGWIGITYSGEPPEHDKKSGTYFNYRTYPVILTVDEGSPAAEAGLQPGDTIVAFDGRDVRRRRIYLAEALRPGNRLRVQVRRGSEKREVTLAVRRRQIRQVATLNELLASPGGVTGRVMYGPAPVIAPTPPMPATPPAPTTPRSWTPRAPLAPRADDAPPMVSGFTVVSPGSFIFNGPMAVAGAELTAMNSDLREALGVASGVLVLRVSAGSPAARAGLRAGDVVYRAGGRTVRTPDGLRSALTRVSDDRRIDLEVTRKGEKRKVVLDWSER